MRFTEDFGLKVEEEVKKMEDGIIESETLIRPPKIEVRGRDDGDNHEEEREREKRQKVEGGGGLLDYLLAKLPSPRTPKANGDDQVFEVNHCDENDDARVRGSTDGNGGGGGGGDGGETGGGGVINNLISSLFHRPGSEGEGEDVKKNGNSGSEERLECGNEESEMNKKGGEESEGGNNNANGGTSLISSLVQDVAAPEADEASILIHSVVHD